MGYPLVIVGTLRSVDQSDSAIGATRSVVLLAPRTAQVAGSTTESAKGIEEMAMEASSEHEALLTPSEVAAMFRVNPKTVTRWARAGKISAIRTLGGHRRFRASEIRLYLEQVDEATEL